MEGDAFRRRNLQGASRKTCESSRHQESRSRNRIGNQLHMHRDPRRSKYPSFQVSVAAKASVESGRMISYTDAKRGTLGKECSPVSDCARGSIGISRPEGLKLETRVASDTARVERSVNRRGTARLTWNIPEWDFALIDQSRMTGGLLSSGRVFIVVVMLAACGRRSTSFAYAPWAFVINVSFYVKDCCRPYERSEPAAFSQWPRGRPAGEPFAPLRSSLPAPSFAD